MIEVSGLTKYYGNKKAVEDLNFTINSGEVVGFLGPNGAGKSTTMNILTGYLSATSGTAKIDGMDILDDPIEAKRHIGYMPEIPPLYLDMTVDEYLNFAAELKGVRAAVKRKHIADICEQVSITHVKNRVIKNLSKGYKQRVGIAQAILGDPEIIILDEPTVGLDPRQIIEIRELIQELGKDHTVILSSHILSEVQAVCQTVMIISKGKLVACDTPENLEKLFEGKATVQLTAECSANEMKKILAGVSGIGAITVSADGQNSSVIVEALKATDDTLCRNIFFAFAKANKAIVHMSMAKATLEDIFIELTDSGKEGGHESGI